jgi:hypothetical protein
MKMNANVNVNVNVFVKRDEPIARPAHLAAGFDYPSTLRGNTAHFNVYYETSMGQSGKTIADGVLASCENEYNALLAQFGTAPQGLPFNVIVASGVGGAYHYGCGAVDLYCDGQKVAAPDVDHTRMLVVAEEVEVFSDSQGAGWDCSASNGEGLSRVLSTELYPAELDGFASAAAWLDTQDRPDFVNNNDPTDSNYVSIGCSVLFLNYLRYQLNFSWDLIVQAGGATLAQTYTNLTGNSDGWTQFRNIVDAQFPVGTPSGVTTDNIFPIAPTSPSAAGQ